MAKVLLYGSIDYESSAEFITAIHAVEDGVLDVLVNSPGGNPEYTWGMVAEFQAFEGTKKVSNHGKAYSMGAFFNLYADECTGLDVTEFLIHRAAYPSWIEDEITKDPAIKGNLERINKSIETAFRAKIDVAKFEALPDMVKNEWTVSDIFALDARREIFITAKQAKQVGLINKIVKCTPEKKAIMEAKMFEIAAKYTPTTQQNVKQENPKKMTLEELQAKHPEIYAQCVKQGIDSERKRVKDWTENAHIDAKAVVAGIESGEPVTMSDLRKFLSAEFSAKQVATLETETNTTVEVAAIDAAEPAKLTPAQEIEAKMFEQLRKDGVLKSEIN